MSQETWRAENTTPAAVAEALRALLSQRHADSEAYAPARVLNMVAVVDHERREEVQSRLDRVGRYHASRTVVCAVQPGRTRIDARASISAESAPRAGEVALVREQVEIDIGPQHLRHLDAIADPVLVSDLITVVWSPHGHAEAVDSLLRLAHVVLLDSVEAAEVGPALERVSDLARSAYVVDLAWLRSTPWRERLAASFDPPQWRPALEHIDAVTIQHRSDSTAAALLLLGWLASRLGWRASPLRPDNGGLTGTAARGRRPDVVVGLERTDALDVPGLCGVTIETDQGMSLSLKRGPGGLSARRRTRDGRSSEWTVLGASRGEGGILGEGVRQALLRDPTYQPALGAARAMLA
ncbi:MAG: glucose-6-phosphate dehydrogenase assembly protein OpcA [Actinomycetota bacterium]|nr:glucose-6-phosphate dehydrogenase assembly protein OpcA [Actinomycetota bacterium]